MMSFKTDPILSLYIKQAEAYFADKKDFFSRQHLFALCSRFGVQTDTHALLEAFYDAQEYDDAVFAHLRVFYYTLYVSGHHFSYLGDTAALARPACDAQYPGAFNTILALCAITHLEERLKQLSLDVKRFADQYIESFHEMLDACRAQYGTPSISTTTRFYFMYGYSLPTILRLGRLSYEYRPAVFAFEDIQAGDPIVTIHIPGGRPLLPEDVDASLEEARQVLPKIFDLSDLHAPVCYTWLLDPQLKNFLPEKSNIRAFQDRFDMKAYRDNTHSIFSHVFRCPPCPLENLVPRNEFERKLLDFVKNGGMMHDGGGVLKQKLW